MFSLRNFSLMVIFIGLHQYTTYASSYELGMAILGDGGAFTTDQVQEVANLITNGVNVNEPTNSGGMFPLHVVFMHYFIPGNEDDIENANIIIELLINAGANINAKMGDPIAIRNRYIRGETPLHIALKNNAPMKLILTLTENNQDCDNFECFSRFLPSLNRHERQKLREMFNQWARQQARTKSIQNNINRINAGPVIFNDGNTALHKAMTPLATENSILNILKTGVNINAIDSNGNTALHLAVERNLYRIVQLLLQQDNIDVSLLNNDGKLALQLANSPQMEQIARNILPENIETNFETTEKLKQQIIAERQQALEAYRFDLAMAYAQQEAEEQEDIYSYNNNLQKVAEGTGQFNEFGRDRYGNLAELD